MNDTNQRQLFSGLTEEQNNKIWERAESFSSDPIIQKSKATELWQGYMKKQQQKQAIEQSNTTGQNLFMAGLSSDAPEIQKKYYDSAKVADMAYSIREIYSNAGKNLGDMGDMDVINLFTKNNKEKVEAPMNQYLFGNKLSKTDALIQMGFQKETAADKAKNAIKTFLESYAGTPVEKLGEGARGVLDNTIGAFDSGFRDESAFNQYINDKYGIAPVELPPQLVEVEKEEFKNNPEVIGKYKPNIADSSLDLGIGAVDTFWKATGNIYPLILTAVTQEPHIGGTLSWAMEGLGDILTYGKYNPLGMYVNSLSSEERKEEAKQFIGGLGLAKILGAKKGGSGNRTFSKEWFNYNFNPTEIINRLNARFEAPLENALGAIKDTAVEGYNKGGVLGAGEALWNGTFDTMANAWEAGKNKLYDSTIGYAKKVGGKAFEGLVDTLFKKEGNVLDRVEDWGTTKIKESPKLMEGIKQGVESGRLPGAGQTIENHIKLSDTFARDFEKTTGKKYGDYLNDEGLYGGADPAKTITKLETRFKSQLDHLDEAFSKIEGTFKDEVFTEMAEAVAKDAQKSYSRTSKEPSKWRALAEKSRTEGLTPKEIRSIKQYFERNNKLDYKKLSEQGNSQNYRKSVDIDSRVRTKLYDILKEYNFEEASAIAKEIQASKLLLDEIGKAELGKYGSIQGLSYSDIVSFSNGSIGTYLLTKTLKELGTAGNKARYVDLVNKATGHQAKGPTRGDIGAIEDENFRQEYIEKPVDKMIATKGLPDKGPTGNEGYNSIDIDRNPIKVSQRKFYNNDYEGSNPTTATYQPGAYEIDSKKGKTKTN